MAAAPANWARVLEFAGFNANVRTVLTDVNDKITAVGVARISQTSKKL
jgi:hypothetical protein